MADEERDYCPLCGEGYGNPDYPGLAGWWKRLEELEAAERELKTLKASRDDLTNDE